MPLEKIMVYFAMVFCIVLELIQMRYNYALKAWMAQRWREDSDAQLDRVKAEMEERLEEAKAAAGKAVPVVAAEAPAKMHPIIIGQNVYVMMPLGSEDAASFKQLMATDPRRARARGRAARDPRRARGVGGCARGADLRGAVPPRPSAARVGRCGAWRRARAPVPSRASACALPFRAPALDVPSGVPALSRAPLDHSSYASAQLRSALRAPADALSSRPRRPSFDF